MEQVSHADTLPVVCITFPVTLSGSEQKLLDAIHSLNLRREDLIQRPLIQIWWMADRLSPLVEMVAPDLTSWFKLKLSLRELSSTDPGDPVLETFERLRMQPNRFREGSLERALAAYERAREQIDPLNPDSIAFLAAAAGRLSLSYGALGMRSEALAPALESLRHYQRLAERNRETYLPDLAMSLNNLANLKSAAGEREDALEKVEEAVKRYRELAMQNREAFQPDLAMSLNNMANIQSEVGQMEQALATAEEAVKLRRELVGLNREAFLSDLARSLINLAPMQRAVGRREEALATAEEAVKLNGELVGLNREAFLPYLATSLNNLANIQSDVGKREEALATAEEAVRLRRELAGRNREAFLPDLALSLGALSQIHASRSEHDLAQAKLYEALTLLVPFFEQHPQAFGQLTLKLAKDYQQACERSSQTPDQSLLARIDAKRQPQ